MLGLSLLLIVLAEVAEARVVTIRWSSPSPPSAVTGFRLYTRTASQSYGTPAYAGAPAAIAGVYSIPLTVSDVAGTYVTATAYNSVGESARSNEQFFAATACGNAVVDAGEACDDGNTASWDGCSSSCTVEVAVCGNGHRQGTEACDDGNTNSWDGCSSSCTVEVAVCGNGHRQGTEACDDGNVVSGDGCSASCVVESNPNGPVAYLINAGGGSFTDSTGKVWSADAGFVKAGRAAFDNVPIGWTNNDLLYQTRRYGRAGGPPLVLEFPVSGIGPFRVRLHFAELDAAITKPGMRVFNVTAENAITIPDVDVFAVAGFGRPLSRIFYVNVDDGALTLSFEPVVGEPMIAGVEIIEGQPYTSAPEFVDPCAESPANCQ